MRFYKEEEKMPIGETPAELKIAIPRTHEFYRPFIDMLWCAIDDSDGLRCTAGGV